VKNRIAPLWLGTKKKNHFGFLQTLIYCNFFFPSINWSHHEIIALLVTRMTFKQSNYRYILLVLVCTLWSSLFSRSACYATSDNGISFATPWTWTALLPLFQSMITVSCAFGHILPFHMLCSTSFLYSGNISHFLSQLHPMAHVYCCCVRKSF
jgi:hypothetical protein